MTDRRMYISEALDHVCSALSEEDISKVDPYFHSKGIDVAKKRAATDKLVISLRRGELIARAETWGHKDKHIALYIGNTACDLPAELWNSDPGILENNKITWRKKFPMEGDMIRPEDYEFAHGVHVSRSAVERIWPLSETSEATANTINSVGTGKKARSGGRPTTHDWAQASGFVASYIVENDYPTVQADLERKLIEWFERTSGKSPDVSDIKRFVRAMYESRPLKG